MAVSDAGRKPDHGRRGQREGKQMRIRWLATVVALLLVGSVTFAAVAASGHDRDGARESASDLNAMDKEFLKSAAAGSQFEIIGGHRAVHHASSAKVIHFGHRMIKDHSLESEGPDRSAPRGRGRAARARSRAEEDPEGHGDVQRA